MKKKRLTNFLTLTLCLAAMLSMSLTALAEDATGKTIKITFGARGEAQSVEHVLVENLDNNESIELSGSDTLLLTSDKEVLLGIGDFPTGKATDLDIKLSDGSLSVCLREASDAVVTVHSLSGYLLHSRKMHLSAGDTQLTLPQLPKGIYIASVQIGRQRKSVKWQCGGIEKFSIVQPRSLGGMMQQAVSYDTSIVNALLDGTPALSAEAHGLYALRFEQGDHLRFTGTSGKMTTIMNMSPHTSHPIYFDLYKCEDADGNNYAIVRAGDMLWMAEDLRVKNVEDVKRIDNIENWGTDANDNSARLYSGGDGVYYSREAAIKAMPEGWSLPTLGEIDYFVKKTTYYYDVCGKALKSRGGEWNSQVGGIDIYSVGITPSGYINNGKLVDQTDAVLLTRSTNNLMPTSFDIRDNSDGLTMTKSYGIHNLGFHVRGVRSAPSAYTAMMKKFGMVPAAKEALASSETDYGPLGKTYTMLGAKQSIAFDFSGGQLNSSGMEKRSGILTFYDLKDDYPFYQAKFSNNGFIEQENKNTLRKMAAMTVNGRQYILEAKIKHPFQLWTKVDENGNVIRTDNHDEFGLAATIKPSDNEAVEIEIYGDSTMNHKMIKKFTVEGISFDAGQFYNNFPYFLYDGRTTEARYDFATRYFQLLAADFTRDGIDEIVLSVGGHMTVLDGAKVLESTKNKATWNVWNSSEVYAFDDFNRWDRGYDGKTVVRLAVGDVDSDNIPELVMLRARNNTYIKKLELIAVNLHNNWGELVLYDDIFQIKHQMYCSLGDANGTSGNIWFLDVKVGNVTNGKYPDIVTLHREYNGKSYANSATLGVYQFNPDATSYDTKFKKIPVKGGTVSGGFRSNAGCAGNCNVTIVRTENGLKSNSDIIVGADLWRWEPDEGKVVYNQQVFSWLDDGNYSIFADNIVTANILGDSCPEMVYYFASMSTSQSGKRFLYTFLGANAFQWYSTGSEYHLLNVSGWKYNSEMFKYNSQGNQWSTNKECELMWWFGDNNVEWGNSAALCAVNINAKSKTLEYRSTQKAFSEPTIYAMIAAPPTYLYGDNEKSPSEDFVTSWGYSRSTGTETSSSGSISASIIGGFEYEFNVPLVGQKVGGVDFTAKLQSEFSKATSSSTSVTYSQTYEARDDNRVVMQITPYTLYTYEITSAENPDEIGGEYHVAIPGKPRTIGLGLADYETLVADAPTAPYLGDVFKHTIGDPFSYPKPGEISSWDIMWGNGKEDSYVTTGSGGATTREIAIEKSSSTSTGFSFSTETELVVTAGCIKAGVGFGYNHSNTISHSETSGFAVSASVPGLVVGDTNPDRTFFDWNLCWYTGRAGGQYFPIVNYVVKPMSWE